MEASNASKKLGLYCLWLLVLATLGVIAWVLSALKPVYSHRPGSQRGLVILIHGLWMRSPCMAVLGSRLAKAGYGVAFIDYGPRADPEGVARRIARMVNTAHAAGQRVYLVGHSCGGNLALLSCRDPEVASRVTSVVCLGSPLLGSASARELQRYPAGAFVLGRAGALLCQAPELPHPAATRVAMLAGTRPHGVGRQFAAVGANSDGTIEVSETAWPGLVERQLVECSHTSLLYSRSVARKVDVFFTTASFGADLVQTQRDVIRPAFGVKGDRA